MHTLQKPRAFPLIFFTFFFTPLMLFALDVEKNDPDQLAKDLVLGNTLFGYELEQTLIQPDQNLVFSPFSITSCLAMAAVGAKKETFSQIKQVLHLLDTSAENDLAFKTLFQKILGDSENKDEKSLQILNALWMQAGHQFLPLFQSRVVNNYLGNLRQADFINDPLDSWREINQWVRESTHEKISTLFQKEQITPATRLVLANTIYVKAAWEQPFDYSNTRKKEFQTGKEQKKTIPFMYQKAHFPYYEEATFSVVELPFIKEDAELVLWIILPKNFASFSLVRQEWDLAKADQIEKDLKNTPIELELPRFHIESDLSMAEPLKKLGMTLPFTENANFSLMTNDSSLYINDIQHKASLSVNERGILATAATGINISVTSMPPPKEWKAVDVSHPFLFMIKDKKTDLILFIGQVIDPKELMFSENGDKPLYNPYNNF